MSESRYDTNPIIDGYYTTFKRIPEEKLNDIPSFEYMLRVGERLDQLAYKNYGNGKLWWVIALVNNVAFEFSDLKVGQKIKIPFNTEDVFKVLSS